MLRFRGTHTGRSSSPVISRNLKQSNMTDLFLNPSTKCLWNEVHLTCADTSQRAYEQMSQWVRAENVSASLTVAWTFISPSWCERMAEKAVQQEAKRCSCWKTQVNFKHQSCTFKLNKLVYFSQLHFSLRSPWIDKKDIQNKAKIQNESINYEHSKRSNTFHCIK